ncbi:putative alpha-1,3-mannosyltransferase [Aspergillus steynii IBT 23096]|uniref:Putative alpha-1,3-mannosyltransferase n=1 Tax=Aspergillus steynii IBT 23096 TaxID=1392250 RepID=A0A2I2G0G6_9EURO|nr:putative alpha-1,3-mannosyltransferase [Aspergillus steynii IBT 23096]PLB46374.1 putative alpha-1,3-mannosyltransferase [Aspergillus steynii IBT 23096]
MAVNLTGRPSASAEDNRDIPRVDAVLTEERNSQVSLQRPSRSNASQTRQRNKPDSESVDFQATLRRVLELLPDELRIRDLLRPLQGFGEERILELGLRTRSFKSLLEPWKALHLISRDEQHYVRDNVIQYLRKHPEIIDSLDLPLSQVIRSYEAYRSLITGLSSLLFPWTAPYYSDHMTLHAQLYGGSRGIVFTAGDHHAPFLMTSIPALRQLGCNLPIEIMYLGDSDLSEDTRALLESLPNVVARDLHQMVNDAGWTLTGWAGKPFAILLSSFREAIFIDADSLFFQNPEVLFRDPSYVDTGALFFKDRLMMPESKKHWLQRILPRPISKHVTQSRFWTGESGHMQESGVVVVDKWKHFVSLLLVTRLNGPDRDSSPVYGRGVYDMVYGDKETFWLGWELAGDTEYEFHDGHAGIMGSIEPPSPSATVNSTDDSPPSNYTICGPQLLHFDRRGKPLWFNGWLASNKFADWEHQQPSNFSAYLHEPRTMRDPGAWQLHGDNICCLTSEHVFEFSRGEADALEMMVDFGRRAGALGRLDGMNSSI